MCIVSNRKVKIDPIILSDFTRWCSVSVFEPLFQQSSNIQLLQFHFYERVLGWRIYSDFRKCRILVDEQHVLIFFSLIFQMILPIGREVWLNIVPEIEWLKRSTLLLGAYSFRNSQNGTSNSSPESTNPISAIPFEYSFVRKNDSKMTDFFLSDIE